MSPEFLGTYTTRFNRRHKLCGHLFSGRYKSLLVDGSTSGYLKAVCDYVHLIPVRAKLLKPEQPLSEYPWSSWPEYLKKPSQRWEWLRVDRLLGEWGVRREMLELIGLKQGPQHYGEELRESDVRKAERMVGEMLRKAGWSEDQLKRRRKGDPKKARMAARLRSETARSWPWVIGEQRPTQFDGRL